MHFTLTNRHLFPLYYEAEPGQFLCSQTRGGGGERGGAHCAPPYFLYSSADFHENTIYRLRP